MNRLIDKIEENPVIAAIKNPEDTDAAIGSPVSTIFLIHADIFNVKELVARISASGKSVFIHIDFLEGIGKDLKAVEYLANEVKPDGIITTRNANVKYAKEKGIFVVQRFFLIDSQSYETMITSIRSNPPDMIEIMPAVMPGVIKKACGETDLPIIAGGLIDSKKDIIDILNAGALGASTGKKELWLL
jgi:glycerol uptake operon antiterminator